MILCDTNILVDVIKGDAQIVGELRVIPSQQIAISVITRAELYFGAFNKIELNKIKHHLDLLTEFSVTSRVSERFVHLMEAYSPSHKPSIPDMLIAATALENQVVLYTHNTKDFRFIPQLSLYKTTTY